MLILNIADYNYCEIGHFRMQFANLSMWNLILVSEINEHMCRDEIIMYR